MVSDSENPKNFEELGAGDPRDGAGDELDKSEVAGEELIDLSGEDLESAEVSILGETTEPSDPQNTEGETTLDLEAEGEDTENVPPEPETEAEAEAEAESADEVDGGMPSEVKMSLEDESDPTHGVLVKHCLFCKETILADAVACKHCGHVVHCFEGRVFKQIWWFFWSGVFVFVGSLLPFCLGEGYQTVSACETLPGAFYLFFSILLIFAMSFNIYSKRMIMGPVFLMFIPAIHTWVILVSAAGRMLAVGERGAAELIKVKVLNELNDYTGSGLWLILLGSTIASLVFFMSLFSAVTGGSGKKQAGKAPRGRSRGRKGR